MELRAYEDSQHNLLYLPNIQSERNGQTTKYVCFANESRYKWKNSFPPCPIVQREGLMRTQMVEISSFGVGVRNEIWAITIKKTLNFSFLKNFRNRHNKSNLTDISSSLHCFAILLSFVLCNLFRQRSFPLRKFFLVLVFSTSLLIPHASTFPSR